MESKREQILKLYSEQIKIIKVLKLYRKSKKFYKNPKLAIKTLKYIFVLRHLEMLKQIVKSQPMPRFEKGCAIVGDSRNIEYFTSRSGVKTTIEPPKEWNEQLKNK